MLNKKHTNLIPHGIILATIVIMFQEHIFGKLTFPWDFLSGYHTHAYGWIRDSKSFTSPPTWFPWTNLGFPAHLAIQSGAWYLPIEILRLFQIEYTLRIATLIQIFHVYIFSAGIYHLCRSENISRQAAALVALTAIFSSTFYSNQQHVDIIRGSALLPWLLFLINPKTISLRWAPISLGFLIFQYLVAAYPGNIVSAAITTFCLFAFYFIKLIENRGDVKRYFYSVFLAAALGISLSLLKWWPVYMDRELLVSTLTAPHPVEWLHMLTTQVHYDSVNFPGDITMRSLFLPAIAFAFILYADKKTTINKFAIASIILSLAFMLVLASSDATRQKLSFLFVSRFPISDWRPVFHTALLLLTASGINEYVKSQVNLNSFKLHLTCGGLSLLTFVGARYLLNYSLTSALTQAAWPLAISIIAFACSAQSVTQHPNQSTNGFSLYIILAVISVANGYYYHNTIAQPWKFPNPTENSFFRIKKQSTPTTDAAILTNERILVANKNGEYKGLELSLAYNYCWYERRHCVFGYDNLKMSKPHRHLMEEISTIDLNSTSKLSELILRRNAWFSAGEEGQDLHTSTEVFLTPVSYEPGRIVYSSRAHQPTLITESEIWWKDWYGEACNASLCKPIEIYQSKDGLRSWITPKGEWQILIEYRPSRTHVLYISSLGIFLSFILIALGQRNSCDRDVKDKIK